MVILVVPFGAHDTPIGHGSVDYQPHAYRADITDPDSKWLVEVPPHVAAPLEHNAGFYRMTQESEPSFVGTARLYAPYGASWGEKRYDPDANKIIVVPAAAVDDLLAFPPICPEEQRPDKELSRAHHSEPSPGPSSQLAGAQSALEASKTLLAKRDKRIAELEGQLQPAVKPSAKPPAKLT